MGQKKHVANLIFTIALLGLFALSALLVSVLGAQVYSRSADKMSKNFDTRTSLVYISEKIRQCPGKDIVLKKVADSDALVLSEKTDGNDYETWIFISDGNLKEVMVKKGDQVTPLSGQDIMELDSFEVTESNKTIKITVQNKFDQTESLVMSRDY